ncbi:hypothetical protein E8E13_007214 [Curvularia kusanoi]|uniref:Uncharacterized protein n=1 Tax=Curvularia kusanoi TaxID=90978 RepID=A0A9P4TD07_CURKU|nr:hypothetical protein E8E13_007214 [Curvularia kusanoi]
MGLISSDEIGRWTAVPGYFRRAKPRSRPKERAAIASVQWTGCRKVSSNISRGSEASSILGEFGLGTSAGMGSHWEPRPNPGRVRSSGAPVQRLALFILTTPPSHADPL